MWLIFGLIVAALVLASCEVILPGGLLGVLAACCIIAAAVAAGTEYGFLVGMAVFIGSLLLILVLIIIEFKVLKNTKCGGMFFLKNTIHGQLNADQADNSIIGKSGIALTRLNPIGKVRVNGHIYEAFSQDGYIEADESVKVVSQDNFKLTIQKL